MALHGLRSALRADTSFSRVHSNAATGYATRANQLEIAAPTGMRSVITAETLEALQSKVPGAVVLAVTATGREAEDLSAGLRSYLPDDAIAEFPSWETLPHERLSPRSDTVGRRLAVLRRLELKDPGLKVIVAPIRAVIQPLVAGLGKLETVDLKVGDEYPFSSVVRALADAAYARVDMVTHRGEFAVRGGILDVFPPTYAHPVRIDFFGDEIEAMRFFSIADQRSLDSEAPTQIQAPPCRELLITPAVMSKAAKLQEHMPAARDMLAKIAGGIAVEGMESLAPLLVDSMVPLLSQLPAESIALVMEPERVRARAHDLEATNAEFLAAAWATASDGGAAPLDLSQAQAQAAADELEAGNFTSLATTLLDAQAARVSWWTLTSLGTDAELLPEVDSIRVDAREPRGYQGDVAEMMQFISSRIKDNWRLVVATDGPGPAQRLAELFHDADIPTHRIDSLESEPTEGLIEITTAQAGRGFVLDSLKLGLLTEADLLGRSSAYAPRGAKRMAVKRRNAVDPLSLLEGDYVVHEQHGIAKFVELIARKVAGGTDAKREYLVLEYAPSKRGAPGDKLFVPTDQLDQVTRYVGGEAPSLSKMGGSDWASTKSKARKAVKEIAGDLIRLYSARMASRGHSFAKDTPWQSELEEAFAYVETPDQLTTINEVKADMEREIPMDRLISGDVGFGKTEIAVRAAFKAVQDSKQVAVLVPTTLLASQHHQTFTDRYSGFPVRVKTLSRFQTAKESKDIIEGLKNGIVDVVIGTHRLLSDTVQFKDLGLVIVDEEQRFGVEHKEQLKKMRTNVDVLSMSATPIPRTLEMSLTGIRETSTLATPPEERHPVLTYVGPRTDKQISAAIRRELMRDGQVFFVHNRVSSIDAIASELRELVPEARVEVAHGKMSESPAGEDHPGLLGEEVRRAGLHHHHRDRPGHLQREHADRGPGGQLRPVPAAPAARARGPRPRARLRLLPVERGEAAGRGGAGTAQGRGRAQRARLRLPAGHEGPGDPRRRQPAGRGAVRAHRRGRVRPVPAPGRRGRGRIQGRCRREDRGDEDRAAGQRAPAARLRAGGAVAPGGLPQDRRGDRLRGARGGARRAGGPLRPAAGGGGEPAGGRPHQDPGPRPGAERRGNGRQLHQVRPGVHREPA